MKPQQWVNAGPDEGAVDALLARVAAAIAIPTIDEVWVFPARRVVEGESVVIVVSTFEAEPERRRILTFRFTIARNKRGEARVTERGDEHGSAPAPAIPRVIEGVLRRLGDDVEIAPHGRAIRGEEERWEALLQEVRAAG